MKISCDAATLICVYLMFVFIHLSALLRHKQRRCVHVVERARVCGFRASLKNPLILNYIDTLSNLAIELNMQVLRNFNIH